MIGGDAVGRQNLQGGALRRPGKRVRILAHVQRAINLFGARYSQIACVMARICASVNVPLSEVPRCPLVPKATR